MSRQEKKNIKEKAEANRAHLSEVFDEYAQEEAPEGLKEEVFGTLDTIQLTADVFDLFTVKFGKTEGKFIEGLTGSDNE